MKPVIAIEMQCEDGHFVAADAYAEMLEKAGASVVHVNPSLNEQALASILDECQGLLLPGGDDINARLYGEEPLPTNDAPVVERDIFEPFALTHALKCGMPVLGICRGMQMMNVWAGGTLDQHLETSIDHWPEGSPAHAHDISILSGSLLEQIAKAQTAKVNSLHRQAANKLGTRVHPEALAPDGTVEALRIDAPSFALGVQWHPELAPDLQINRRVLSAFLSACS